MCFQISLCSNNIFAFPLNPVETNESLGLSPRLLYMMTYLALPDACSLLHLSGQYLFSAHLCILPTRRFPNYLRSNLLDLSILPYHFHCGSSLLFQSLPVTCLITFRFLSILALYLFILVLPLPPSMPKLDH